VGHWFDGDGGVLGIHFTDAGATGVYRYVQTQGYREESQAGRFLFGGYGMLPPGSLWARWTHGLKNAANTSVLALPDRLLALWEGGLPHALTLDTLETLKLDDLGGLGALAYSAHPKCDPQTGDLYNFSVSIGNNSQLNVFRSDTSGTIRQQGTIALQGMPLIHDFVLAGRYLVFCIPPARIKMLPVLFRLQSFSDAMTWHPELGTEILVIDRNSFEVVSRFQADPWYQWHFGNGYELRDGSVVFTIARYADFQTNQRLKEVATGQIQTPAVATLWQLRLNPQSGQVLEMQQLSPRSCEFPTLDPQDVGQPSRYTYLNLHRSGANVTQELFGTIARFDHQTATVTEANLGEHTYPSEPIYAPDADRPEQGWILTVVYNGELNQSTVWIFAADRLDAPPVCQLTLPQVVPLGFHGTWRSRS
jgi:carotenoid cleavage dioxygenase-like enzyme